MTTNREMTFEEFSKKLDGFSERCGSCKYFERNDSEQGCYKHKKPVTNKSPRCDDWRYFG